VHLVRQLKTKSSRRHILLPRIAADALAAHRTRQAADRALAGSNWEENDLVFPNTVGRPINPSNFLLREFYPLLRGAGLPRMRFHDLRHSAATLLLGLGVHPKVVSEMLGHTPRSASRSTYTHTSPLPCSSRRSPPSTTCSATLSVRQSTWQSTRHR
jgi:integrase